MNNKLSDLEWVKLTKKFIEYYDGGRNQRVGQAYMNSLREVNHSLYNEITGTDDDPFYNDNNVVKFIRRLNE